MQYKGFTLIELMIVVAIVGILSMIAMPSYQDYTKRTYVAEGMALASGAKSAIVEHYSTTGKWPGNNSEAGLPAANKMTGQAVQGIALARGRDHVGGAIEDGGVTDIVIYYNEKLMGQLYPTPAPADPTEEGISGYVNTVTLSATVTEGSIRWICTARGFDVKARWIPPSCRNTLEWPYNV